VPKFSVHKLISRGTQTQKELLLSASTLQLGCWAPIRPHPTAGIPQLRLCRVIAAVLTAAGSDLKAVHCRIAYCLRAGPRCCSMLLRVIDDRCKSRAARALLSSRQRV
jgi:hypothetical protein